MKHYSKQFTEWVTNLKRNPFEQARLKLTSYYLLIMVLIMAIFSFALIGVLENNIKASLKDIEESSRMRHEVLLETRDDVEGVIFIIDSILLIIIGGMSYFLAGKTLSPIKKNFEMQKRFTADASHDLRTPLTIMKTEMEVALQSKHEDSERYKKVLHSGLEEIQTMSLLIEDLLALARSENIYKEEECESIDYSTCISSLLERINHQVLSKGIKINVNIITNGYIFVNKQNFTRVLQNVLNNAIHYTPNNGSIDVTLSKQSKHIILTLTDTGVGISNNDLPHVFDRFYKAEHSRNDSGGSGLGLSIAKEFIERYGGKIKINSKQNIGTTVVITMPEAS